MKFSIYKIITQIMNFILPKKQKVSSVVRKKRPHKIVEESIEELRARQEQNHLNHLQRIKDIQAISYAKDKPRFVPIPIRPIEDEYIAELEERIDSLTETITRSNKTHEELMSELSQQNNTMQVEIKKANRSMFEKFQDADFVTQAAVVYGGMKVYQKLKEK